MLRHCAELKRAMAIGALFLTAGCGLDGLFGHSGGRVKIVLAPDGGALGNLIADSAAALAHRDDDNEFSARTWSFQAASVTLSSIMARTIDGELVSLDVALPIAVDVVRIEGGNQVVLPDGFLPADTYDQVVLVMTAVQGVTNDGTVITVEPPGGGWTSVVPICPIEVSDAAAETVGIAFNVRNSFLRLGLNNFSFQPRFRSLTALSSCETAAN